MNTQATGELRLPRQSAISTIKYAVSVFLHDESGQDLIEYALIAGLIGLGAIASLHGLSSNLASAFSKVGSVMVSST